jgi:hypothetical protein
LGRCRFGKEHVSGKKSNESQNEGYEEGVDPLGEQVNEVFNVFLKETAGGFISVATCMSEVRWVKTVKWVKWAIMNGPVDRPFCKGMGQTKKRVAQLCTSGKSWPGREWEMVRRPRIKL